MEEQVRSKFKSTVHFCRSAGTKEFFLVVSFSSASFSLTAEAVGVVLQCCIGGLAHGFNVIQLGKRSFRFSVASNHVGHFIYALKDRIWPNFVCHFRLFKPYVDYSWDESYWHSDNEIADISARSPLAIKSPLNFLKHSAHLDSSGDLELAKFGFSRDQYLSCQPEKVNSNVDSIIFGLSGEVIFGSFQFPKAQPEIKVIGKQFLGSNFKLSYWQTIPDSKLYEILDLWQAGYADPAIMSALKISSVPTKDFIYSALNRCSDCFRLGHVDIDCPGTTCKQCISLGYTCNLHDRVSGDNLFCKKCLASGHLHVSCMVGLRCKVCGLLGYMGWQCNSGKRPRAVWRKKVANFQAVSVVQQQSPTQYMGQQNFRNRTSVKSDLQGQVGKQIWVVKQNKWNGEQSYLHPPKTSMVIQEDDGLLNFLWTISFGRYTRCIAGPDEQDTFNTQLPLNLLALYISVVDSIVQAHANATAPPGHEPSFLLNFTEGITIPIDIWSEFATVLTVNNSNGEGDETFAPLLICTQEENVLPSMVEVMEDEDTCLSEHIDAHNLPAVARIAKRKKVVPKIDPTLLRRSNRANKYDGFKAPSMAEGKTTKSKVKPRHIPAAPNQGNTTSAVLKPVPPPTPIPTLQHIGSVHCGIPAEDLSAAKLSASKEKASSSSSN